MNQTNIPSGIQVPGIDYLPVSWQGPALVVLFLVPYITRAYHALVNDGGFVGVKNAILFGTNVPSPKEQAAIDTKADKV